MAWKLKLIFDDGDSEVLDEEYETEQEAIDEYNSFLDNWAMGAEVLELAGEDFDDRDIVDCEIWEE